jgi:NAD(P)-dependent dehydrogenase (short-subunit alcohol dehydrogenase family)
LRRPASNILIKGERSWRNKKVAIVTGATRSIGAAVAERLAKDDFVVVINYAGGAARADALNLKIEQAGGHQSWAA